MTSWDTVQSQLRAYPIGTHRLLPPCPEPRLEAVQAELGTIPEVLVEMLRRFNGAELFEKCGALITIFGISTTPPLPPMDWAEDWYIDKFTPTWRSVFSRPQDWTVAMWNYGVLVVLDQYGWSKSGTWANVNGHQITNPSSSGCKRY
jgi:hypothetical protein